MSISVNTYARALYEAAEQKSKAEVRELVDNFLQMLRDKNALKFAPAVMAEVEKLDDTAEGIIRAQATSAHRLEEALFKKFEKIIMVRTGAKKVVWQKEIDKDLFGGVVIKYNDTILDLSLATTITSLADHIHYN